MHFLGAFTFAKNSQLNEKSRRTQLTLLGPADSQTLSTTNNLAAAYLSIREPDKAIPLLEEVLRFETEKFGNDHAALFTTKTNLAAANEMSGRYTRAIQILEELLQYQKEKLGPEHAATLGTMAQLAGIYDSAGRTREATELYEKTCKVMQKQPGVGDLEALTAMENLATMYARSERIDEAIQLLKKALDQREMRLGKDHPRTLVTLRNLAITYRDGGHGDEAEQTFDEYFERVRRVVGSDKSVLAEKLVTDAPKLMKYQRFERAERFLRESLAIYRQQQAAGSTLLKTQSLIGAALLGQHKHAEAEAVLLEVFEGLNRQNDSNAGDSQGADLASTADLLVRFYSEWNKPDEASKWKAKRAKLLGASPDG